jgi:osmoprotectant transport system ATP-binding protein
VPPAIEILDVHVAAPGGTVLLRGVDLRVEKGECVALVGRSGAGKSTTLRLVNGLVRPTRGQVLVEGTPLDGHDVVALRRRVGYVIQQVGLLPHLDVAQNIGVVPRLLGWDRARVAARVDEVLALVGLDPERFRHRRPRALSGGEQQRVGIARALAAEPSIVLMDEPFGALDPLVRAELRRDMSALRRRLGTTLLIVTHDVHEAAAMGDRVVLVDGGVVAYDGPPDALATSENETVRAYAALLADGRASKRARDAERGAARGEA